MDYDVILASASPRRKELLKQIFSDFRVIASNVDETVPSDVSVYEYPEYLSKIKALDVAKNNYSSLVIGADTVVLLDGEILGKPKSKVDASIMLR